MGTVSQVLALRGSLPPSKERVGLLANAVVYGGTGVVTQVVRLAQEVALRRLLVPEVIGIIGLADLVQSTVKSLDLGILAAAGRELPLVRGAGDAEQEGLVRVTALRGYIVQHVLCGIPIVVYALLAVSDRRICWALLAAAVAQVLTAACEGRQLVLQSAQKFIGLGRVTLMFSMSYAAGVVVGAKMFGLAGVLVGGMLAWAAQDLWLRRCVSSQGLRDGGRFEFGTLKGLVRFGLPLRFCDYPTAFAVLIDSMLVGKLLGLEGLAIYTTLRAFCGQALELPSRFSSVVLMRLYHDEATGGRMASAMLLRRFLMIQYFLILPAIICAVVVCLRLLTSCVLPRYTVVMPLAEVLLFEMYFVPQISLMRNYWIIDKKLDMIAASGGVWLLSRGVLLLLFLQKLGLGLTGAVWACLISAVLYFFFLLFAIGRSLWGGGGAVRIGFLAVFAAAYTGVVVRKLDAPVSANWLPALMAAGRQLFGILVLLSPLLVGGYGALQRSRRAETV